MATGQNNQQGFTLLEVMIALIIIALTLGAYIKVSSKRANDLLYLENKSFALWVAQDVANKIRAGQITLPKTLSELSGDETILNQHFQWMADFETSQDGKSVRGDIKVNLKNSKNAEKNFLSRYVTYFIAP